MLSQAEQTEVRLQHAGKLAWPMKLFVFGCVLFCSVWLGAVSLVLVTLCVILALLFFSGFSVCAGLYKHTVSVI